MGDFETGLQPPSGALRVPDVTLTRPSLLGPAVGSATLDSFELGKAELTPTHHKQIADLAAPLKRLLAEPPGGRVQAIGHTDKVGSDEKNVQLGQDRADAVRDELTKQGVDAADVRTGSLGESVPVVDTPKPEPRNRRVEVYFSPNSGPKYPSVLSGGLKRPEPLPSTTPPKVPGFDTGIDYCKLLPQDCDPNRISPDIYKPIPGASPRKLPSVTHAVWDPIDKALERGLRKLGIDDTWNRRLRDAARAGAEKGVSEILDKTLDAARLTGDTRKAVDAALRSAAQLEIPF
jgi:hypothetical protein